MNNENFLDLQNSMRAVTLNSEFSLCGLIRLYVRLRIPVVMVNIWPKQTVSIVNNNTEIQCMYSKG